ncbi:MAG: transposase [Acidobacteriia bacterium]|nr:transposase [Terriglobia bacterium]
MAAEPHQPIRFTEPAFSESIEITTNGIIISGFAAWHDAVSEGQAILECIEHVLTDEQALEFIIRHHRPRRAWNNFVRVVLALELEPHFQKKALANQIAGGKYKRLRRIVTVKYALKEFIERWIKQLPDPYRHAIRYFGLFAPRVVSQNFSTIFSIIGQVRRPRPKRLPWALSIKRDFGWDPLLDHSGRRMQWVRRLPPILAE